MLSPNPPLGVACAALSAVVSSACVGNPAVAGGFTPPLLSLSSPQAESPSSRPQLSTLAAEPNKPFLRCIPSLLSEGLQTSHTEPLKANSVEDPWPRRTPPGKMSGRLANVWAMSEGGKYRTGAGIADSSTPEMTM